MKIRSTCDRCGKPVGGTYMAAGVYCSEACADARPDAGVEDDFERIMRLAQAYALATKERDMAEYCGYKSPVPPHKWVEAFESLQSAVRAALRKAGAP